MKDVSPKKLKTLLHDGDHDEILIDVRTPAEYRGAHVDGAENIPLEELVDAVDRVKGVGTVYVMCASGTRSAQAYSALEERGVNVVNVSGGLRMWQKFGLHVSGSGKVRIPIIRQVMITAGILILLGATLGWLVHPYWFGLSAFVGAGLLFAGISGICSMSWILSKMPWNR